MADTVALTREQQELLAMLVKARREAGPEDAEGFRAPLFLRKEDFRCTTAGSLWTASRSLSALAAAGFVVLHQSGINEVLRVDLTRAAFTDPEEQKRLAA